MAFLDRLPEGMTPPRLAAICGCDRTWMWRVLAGKVQEPDPKLVTAIHRATAGAVPCWELRSDLWAPGQVPPELADCLPPDAA